MKYVQLDSYGRREDPFYFAVESVLLEDLNDDVFFIWRVFDAVIIGKHQLLQNEVNQSYTTENKIKIFRRLSGGGAVFSDRGCIKYSFITKEFNKETVFKDKLERIKSVFDYLKIPVEISGRNDVLYENKKFSGNAYYRTKHGSCLHGTILFDTDFEKLVRSISPSDEKLISKGITSVRSRVINMKDVVGLNQEDFETILVNQLCDGVIELTENQIKRIKAFEKTYHSEAFIYQKNPPYQYKKEKRFACGSIGLTIEVKKEIITDVFFYGDFFLNQELDKIKQTLFGQSFTNLKVRALFKEIEISDYINELSNDEFYELFPIERGQDEKDTTL